MVVNPQQRVDRERQPRRLELCAVETGAAGADEMNARQPVPGDDLRKRRLALHQFGKPGRHRIDRRRGNRRRECHEIDDHDFRLLRHQPRQRQRGQRDALARCRTEHGHLARLGACADQDIRHLLDFHARAVRTRLIHHRLGGVIRINEVRYGKLGRDRRRAHRFRRRSQGDFGGDFALDFRRSRTGSPRRGHAQQLAGRNRTGGEQQGRQRRDQHDRQLLRIGRGVRNGGARDDAAIGRRRLDILAGIRLAVFGEIGFQEIALRLGFALQRPQLHVLAIIRGRLLLQLVEARAQAVDPAAGNAGVVLQRAGDLAGFLAQLAVEIAKLGLQFLDAGMAVEQRRGLLGQLRAQRHPLLGHAPDRFGIEHFGSLDRPAALKHLLDQPRLRFRIRLQRAGVVELRVQLTHLLVGQRGVVGADEQARLGAEILDAGFGFRNLLAQIVDLAGKPLAGSLRLILPRVLLQHQITFRDRVGDARGKFGIARLELDDDDAGFVDRIGREALIVGFQHALFRRQRKRVASDADQGQQ